MEQVINGTKILEFTKFVYFLNGRIIPIWALLLLYLLAKFKQSTAQGPYNL
jgi:hypothetical protein